MSGANIIEVDLNKATYRPGEPVELTVFIGAAEAPFQGKARVEMFHLTERLEHQEQTVSVEVGGKSDLRFTLTPPAESPRGYGIVVSLLDSDGTTVATSSTAFDVLERWSQAPRYGFLSSFGPEIDGDAIDAAACFLRRFHIDVVQFYDWMWRHYRLLPPQDNFTDALGRPTSLRVVKESIAAVQRIGAAAMAYGAVYGAEPEYADEHREQVLFDAEGNPISLAELFYIMDIAPESPWNTMIVEEFAETVRTLDFDGIHLDQYGFPKGEVRNGVGTTRDLVDDFPPLIDRSRAAVRAEKSDAGVIFNAVGNWPIERVAPTSQDAIYIEVWPPDVDDNDLRRLIREAKALGRGQQVILAAYLTPFLEQPQAPESEAAALLATAAIASAGGFHLLLGERNGILCDPYYPKFGTLREAFVPRLRAFYDHLVRFQEWMTADGVKDWEVELDGEGVTPAATVGAVWAIARSTADARIVHLVDLRDQTATEWNAPRTPWAGGKPPVRLSLPIDEPVREVLLISPDLPAGSPISIPHDPSAASVTVEFEMPGPWASVVVRV